MNRPMLYVTSNEQMAKAEERLATQSEIASKLLCQNISPDVIVKATRLTIEQV
jgi:hypothetical protein